MAAKNTKGLFQLGRNVVAEVKENQIVLTIDTTQTHGPSKTGKTLIVATTSGNQEIGDTGVFVGVNAYRYPTPR